MDGGQLFARERRAAIAAPALDQEHFNRHPLEQKLVPL
jgi:hypothetical protein